MHCACLWQWADSTRSAGTFNPGTKTLRGGAAKVAATGRLTAAQVAIAAIPAKKQRVADKPLASPCQRCGAAHLGGKFTTLQTGSMSAELCACMPGFGGSSCSACPAVRSHAVTTPGRLLRHHLLCPVIWSCIIAATQLHVAWGAGGLVCHNCHNCHNRSRMTFGCHCGNTLQKHAYIDAAVGYYGVLWCACLQGTYSEGGTHAVCKSCPARGAGYTTNPISAATSMASCVW